MTEAVLRGIFVDICRGYSRATWDGSPVFIRHFSHYEQLETELEREKYFNIARDKKIPTKEEKVEWLIQNELWSKDKEKKIRDFSFFIEQLKKSKDKAMTAAMGKEYEKQIVKAQNDLDSLLFEKNRLIGLTAEIYAEQKLQSSYIFHSFAKDKNLEIPLFTEKQFKKLDDEEIDELFIIYLEHIKKFTIKNVKKIAISGFFTSYFYLSEDFSKFFNKPICDLTYNQINLIHYGSSFRRIFSEMGDSIPENIKNNPEKLEEFYNRKKNAPEPKPNTKKGQFTAVIGASKDKDGDFLGDAKDDIFEKGEIDTAWSGIKSGKLKVE